MPITPVGYGSGAASAKMNEVIDAVNGVQTVVVGPYATATARDTAIPSGERVAGMLCYLSTPKWWTSYDGSAWVVLNSLDRIGTTCTRATAQSMTGGALTAISWTAETPDTDAFITVPSTTVTIPAGCGGLYAVTLTLSMAAGIASSFPHLATGGNTYSPPGGNVGAGATLAIVRPLAAGDTVVASLQNGAATTNLNSARLDVYRVGP